MINDKRVTGNPNIGWQYIKDDLNNINSTRIWDLSEYIRSHPITMAELEDMKKYTKHARNESVIGNLNYVLHSNRYLTIKFVQDNPTFPWNYEYLSDNMHISAETKHLPIDKWIINQPISSFYVEDDPKLTLEAVLANLNDKWAWFKTAYPDIDFSWRQHIDFHKKWNWHRLLNRGIITADHFIKLINDASHSNDLLKYNINKLFSDAFTNVIT